MVWIKNFYKRTKIRCSQRIHPSVTTKNASILCCLHLSVDVIFFSMVIKRSGRRCYVHPKFFSGQTSFIHSKSYHHVWHIFQKVRVCSHLYFGSPNKRIYLPTNHFVSLKLWLYTLAGLTYNFLSLLSIFRMIQRLSQILIIL